MHLLVRLRTIMSYGAKRSNRASLRTTVSRSLASSTPGIRGLKRRPWADTRWAQCEQFHGLCRAISRLLSPCDSVGEVMGLLRSCSDASVCQSWAGVHAMTGLLLSRCNIACYWCFVRGTAGATLTATTAATIGTHRLSLAGGGDGAVGAAACAPRAAGVPAWQQRF